MIIYRAYEQLTPFYDDVSGTSKPKLSPRVSQCLAYFTISQFFSGKSSLCHLVNSVLPITIPCGLINQSSHGIYGELAYLWRVMSTDN